jgi:NAD(P)-dependent dehydrogenase (short-subunit alcohol dehydrogenase family)
VIAATDSSNQALPLLGRVAIITGGARGIGRATAELMASLGAGLVVNDSGVDADGQNPDPHLVRHLVSSITDSGGRAVANHDDVSDTEVGERLVEQAIESFGRLDIVVNAAGILRDRMVFNMSDEEWDEVIRVHLRGHFSTIRPAALYWRSRRNRDGHYRIINVTSDSGLQGSPGQANYAAAKMGIVGLTYSSAQALARYGVTANAIAPGALTRMIGTIPNDKQLSGIDESFTPENVAAVIAYVAGERTDWLTGRVLGVSGLDVRLFANPEVVASVVRSSAWSDDELDEQFQRIIRPHADGLPPSSFASQLQES